MLTKLKKKDFAKYIDWSYNLALDISHSSFPTYSDGVKSKQDFINTALRSFSDTNREILLFIHDGKVCGWINYYFLPEDKYVGLEAFNTENNTKIALKEFENYCKSRFKGYSLYLGFSTENKEAVAFFNENGYKLLETSYPNVFHFADFKPLKCSNNVIEITKENFNLFESLHSAIDEDMYWNVKRIYDNFDNWHIYYYEDKNTRGAIYFTGKTVMEIFGVDFLNSDFNFAVFKELLIKCMNVCHSLLAEHLYYFSENNESKILSELGFKCLGKYNCYTLRLT